jgi:hypothetical protein
LAEGCSLTGRGGGSTTARHHFTVTRRTTATKRNGIITDAVLELLQTAAVHMLQWGVIGTWGGKKRGVCAELLNGKIRLPLIGVKGVWAESSTGQACPLCGLLDLFTDACVRRQDGWHTLRCGTKV